MKKLSRVGVTYKTGFGLNDWIYWTLCTRNLELQIIQRYRYSTQFAVYRYTRTPEFSVFASRILATDL
jgi:hypothetical protein